MTTASDSASAHTETATTSLMVLGEALRLACVELMENYGIEARPRVQSASEPPTSVLVAGVDFKGCELRGTVALWAAESVLLETTRKAPGLGDDPGGLPDWTCELTNQLAGRMKNKLRNYGVSLNVDVPRLLRDGDVTELEQGLQHRFSCDFGTLSAYLDVLIAPGFVLKEAETSEPLKQEGDLTVF